MASVSDAVKEFSKVESDFNFSPGVNGKLPLHSGGKARVKALGLENSVNQGTCWEVGVTQVDVGVIGGEDVVTAVADAERRWIGTGIFTPGQQAIGGCHLAATDIDTIENVGIVVANGGSA